MNRLLSKHVSVITPHWPAPLHVKAYATQRYPGNSAGLYAGLNLALHVGDNSDHVVANRHTLKTSLALPDEPRWLNQVHSNIPVLAETMLTGQEATADASYTQKTDVICAVLVGDCLPILITNQEGTEVAAIHAGWRGLAAGIVDNTFASLYSAPQTLMAWIGPSISPDYYEVGEDVYTAFAQQHSSKECQQAFQKKMNTDEKKWLANMPLLAHQRLEKLGVPSQHIYLSNECTYRQPDRYFSYRRDGITGRIACMIVLT